MDVDQNLTDRNNQVFADSWSSGRRKVPSWKGRRKKCFRSVDVGGGQNRIIYFTRKAQTRWWMTVVYSVQIVQTQ